MKTIDQVKLRNNEKKALKELKERILERFPNAKIILYGSKARGDDEEFADIDLLILIDSQLNTNIKEEITEIKYKMELKYDVVFGTIIENIDFWKSAIANGMPLHWNIDREGIRICASATKNSYKIG